jgi:hypothetical protein
MNFVMFVVCLIRNNLENALLPEMKQCVDQLKQMRDSQRITEQSPSTARLTVRMALIVANILTLFLKIGLELSVCLSGLCSFLYFGCRFIIHDYMQLI